MSNDPYQTPSGTPTPPPAKSGGMGMVVVVILLVLLCGGGAVVGVGGVLVALMMPAVSAARDAAEGMKHKNDLKQLGLAYHLYVDEHGTAPQAWEDVEGYLDPMVRSELESRGVEVRWGTEFGDVASSQTVLAFPMFPDVSDRPTVSVLMLDGSVSDMSPKGLEASLDATP